MSFPLGTTSFNSGNYPAGCSALTVSDRSVPPYDGRHEARRALADELRERRRLDRYYTALAALRRAESNNKQRA